MVSSNEQASVAFDALYRDTGRDLYAYVMTVVRDQQTAEDVTHTAYERAYRKQRSFRESRGSQRAWLFGIARNAALDELRRKKRTASLLDDIPDEDPSRPDDPILRTVVRSALAELDARDRELIALKFYAGLSHREIADVVGISESNAGTALHRALKRLREACDA